VPWDAGAAAPELKLLVGQERLPTGRALVPGSGSGYDVLALASEDRAAVGVDLAPGAGERFRELRSERQIPAERARFVAGDFFELEFEGLFDLIWDYTFLCAIEPERRKTWARRCSDLLRPGGTLAVLLFPVVPLGVPPVPADGGGPPYRLTPELAAELLKEDFELCELRLARESHPGREDKEWCGLWRKPT
jgi:hypothetical protein